MSPLMKKNPSHVSGVSVLSLSDDNRGGGRRDEAGGEEGAEAVGEQEG